MANPTQTSVRLVFGPFQLDPASGELDKHGTAIKLAKQPAQILEAMLHRPGEVITREELHQLLWRDQTFGDFEHGLNAAINKLRQTLGDSADQPRYIETLPGRGYRFIAPVQKVLPAPKTPPILRKVEPKAIPVRRSSKMWAGAMILLAGGLAMLYWIASRPSGEALRPVVRFTVAPPPGYFLEPGGTRQSFAVSADGSRLAFTAVDAENVYRIFMRDFTRLECRALPGSEGAHNIFWSADGSSLFAHIRGTLRRTGPEGGSYQEICELPPVYSGVSLPSGRILLSNRLRSWAVPGTGGTPQAAGNQAYAWAQMLPDGEHLLYIGFDSSGRTVARAGRFERPDSVRDLMETGSKVVYAPSAVRADTGYLLYARAGNLLAQPFDPRSLRLVGAPTALADRIFTFDPTGAADFSVSATGVLVYVPFIGRSQIAWLDRSGRELATVGPANVGVKYARLSPDQRKIAADIYDLEKGATAIWILDAVTGAPRRLTSGPGQITGAIWSPDSKRVVFVRAFGGNPPRIFMKGVGENDPEEALVQPSFQIPTDWSPDGRYIAYTNTAFPLIANEQSGDVWVVDLKRDRKITAILHTPFRESTAVFSPDGRELAFIADDSGRPEIYVQSFESADPPRVTGERRLVSHNGALYLRWQRDGRAIFYLGTDNRVYTVPISSGAQRFGAPTPLFRVPAEARAVLPHAFGFDVADDGRFLVPTLRSSDQPSFVVVQNWEQSLKR
jgi:eukaryotic-like serine/threonine-protein kinase